MSSVSRSVYQKLMEENKRLLKDIEILVQSFDLSTNYSKLQVINKWREKIEKERKQNNLLRELIMKHNSK